MTALSGRRRSAAVTAVLLGTVALTACATKGPPRLSPEELARQNQAIESLSAGKPAVLKGHYASIVRGGNRDAALNWMRLGKAAMDAGHFTEAAEAFDEALTRITAVYADDPQAEKARSVWHEESVKDFKGEPYERAMAFVYRGILDMLAGDYENARASFKGAMIQDSFAELERHRQDFASAAWLIGWTSRCLGDEAGAREAFAEARDLRPALPLPREDDRLLVLLEAGGGPAKEAHGQHREQLAFREGQPPQASYAVSLGEEWRTAVTAEDLFVQATTRGGRQMDDILAMKAGTKTTTSAMGAGATAVGVGMMTHGNYYSNSDATAAGLIVALIGLAAQAAAEGMTAEADTRHWNTLPHSLYVATLPVTGSLAPGAVSVTFEAAPEKSALLSSAKTYAATHAACDIAWTPARGLRTSVPASPHTGARPGSETADTNEPKAGNCRTSAGELKNLRAAVCRSINGTVLSDRPR